MASPISSTISGTYEPPTTAMYVSLNQPVTLRVCSPIQPNTLPNLVSENHSCIPSERPRTASTPWSFSDRRELHRLRTQVTAVDRLVTSMIQRHALPSQPQRISSALVSHGRLSSSQSHAVPAM